MISFGLEMHTIKQPYFNYLFTLLVVGIDPGTRHIKYFLSFLYPTRESTLHSIAEPCRCDGHEELQEADFD